MNYKDIEQLTANNKNYLKRLNCKKDNPEKLNAVQSRLPNAMMQNSWLNMKNSCLRKRIKN